MVLPRGEGLTFVLLYKIFYCADHSIFKIILFNRPFYYGPFYKDDYYVYKT